MNISLFYSIDREFSVNAEGVTYSSKKGLGRLCGVKINLWGKGKFFFNKEIDTFISEELEINLGVENKDITSLGIFEEKGFVIVEKQRILIQDILCSLVIEFYANVKRIPEARLTNRALRAIGLRTAIQKTLGWSQQPKKYEDHILAEPRKWTKVFEDDYYDELSRLTGLKWDKKTHRKPHKFAVITKQIVYGYLPNYVYDTIKKHQKEHEGQLCKMHQFFDSETLNLLRNHLQRVIYILSSETSLERATQLIHQAVTKEYQYRLFG